MGIDAGSSGDDVGSLAEEAAKFFGALSDVAKETGSETAHGLGAMAGHAADAARGLSDGVATGAAECQWCPVCRVVHAVRETSPEVKEHLAVAAASLMQALAGVLATHVPQAKPDRGGGVEHIDLDGGMDEGRDEGQTGGPAGSDDE